MLLSDMRRAQMVGPELASMIRAETDLTRKYEDLKAQFIKQITPYITGILRLLEKVLPEPERAGEAMKAIPGILGQIGLTVPILAILHRIHQLGREMQQKQEELKGPTDLLMGSPNPFSVFQGLPTPNVPREP